MPNRCYRIKAKMLGPIQNHNQSHPTTNVIGKERPVEVDELAVDAALKATVFPLTEVIGFSDARSKGRWLTDGAILLSLTTPPGFLDAENNPTFIRQVCPFPACGKPLTERHFVTQAATCKESHVIKPTDGIALQYQLSVTFTDQRGLEEFDRDGSTARLVPLYIYGTDAQEFMKLPSIDTLRRNNPGMTLRDLNMEIGISVFPKIAAYISDRASFSFELAFKQRGPSVDIRATSEFWGYANKITSKLLPPSSMYMCSV